jgi:hypothetical protein
MFKKIFIFSLIAIGATLIGHNIFASTNLQHVFNGAGSGSFNFTDQSGNTETIPANVSNIDNTAPTGEIIAPYDNSSIKNGGRLSVKADDGNGSGIGGVLFYY